MEIIYDVELFEKKIEEIKEKVMSLTESQLNTPFNKYPKHVFAPIQEYLENSFTRGLVAEGLGKVKGWADKFAKGAWDIAKKIGSSITQFSFKKLFATVTKMMLKIKVKILQGLMFTFEPFRETILKNNFCDEKNRVRVKEIYKKLIEIAKSAGKEEGADQILDDKVTKAISQSVDMEGVGTLTAESLYIENIFKILEDKEIATFDEKDAKYLGFFEKMMLKLGVTNGKWNGFLATLAKKITQGAAVGGVLAVIAALTPSASILAGIAGAVGAAVAAAPAVVMIIGAILFGIGLFMFLTWLLKPYPTIANCEIFLSTIFDGSNVFDYPEKTVQDVVDTTQPADVAKKEKHKPAFDIEYIDNIAAKGSEFEADIPDQLDKDEKEEVKKVIANYDDLDIEILEKEEEIKDNRPLVSMFVRNIMTENGREDIREEIKDSDENDYTEALTELLDIVEDCYIVIGKIKDDEGKKLFTFALDKDSVKSFLKDKDNSLKKRIGKVIDVVDNLIDRFDKSMETLKFDFDKEYDSPEELEKAIKKSGKE